MNYDEFLTLTIEDGIEAARLDYSAPRQRQKLRGSILGFEECRHCDPPKLAALLSAANAVTLQKYREQASGSA